MAQRPRWRHCDQAKRVFTSSEVAPSLGVRYGVPQVQDGALGGDAPQPHVPSGCVALNHLVHCRLGGVPASLRLVQFLQPDIDNVMGMKLPFQYCLIECSPTRIAPVAYPAVAHVTHVIRWLPLMLGRCRHRTHAGRGTAVEARFGMGVRADNTVGLALPTARRPGGDGVPAGAAAMALLPWPALAVASLGRPADVFQCGHWHVDSTSAPSAPPWQRCGALFPDEASYL